MTASQLLVRVRADEKVVHCGGTRIRYDGFQLDISEPRVMVTTAGRTERVFQSWDDCDPDRLFDDAEACKALGSWEG